MTSATVFSFSYISQMKIIFNSPITNFLITHIDHYNKILWVILSKFIT
ncbi:hypothetical protein JNUCC42_04255 [Brevibacterium sp. JNUCC-42]|nr:hypothetical protein JNUCC42_04255 [Brevibacterium sp. JNUCC-42]